MHIADVTRVKKSGFIVQLSLRSVRQFQRGTVVSVVSPIYREPGRLVPSDGATLVVPVTSSKGRQFLRYESAKRLYLCQC